MHSRCGCQYRAAPQSAACQPRETVTWQYARVGIRTARQDNLGPSCASRVFPHCTILPQSATTVFLSHACFLTGSANQCYAMLRHVPHAAYGTWAVTYLPLWSSVYSAEWKSPREWPPARSCSKRDAFIAAVLIFESLPASRIGCMHTRTQGLGRIYR